MNWYHRLRKTAGRSKAAVISPEGQLVWCEQYSDTHQESHLEAMNRVLNGGQPDGREHYRPGIDAERAKNDGWIRVTFMGSMASADTNVVPNERQVEAMASALEGAGRCYVVVGKNQFIVNAAKGDLVGQITSGLQSLTA
jgi:hypothetical protein